jgi:hypothetical protein
LSGDGKYYSGSSDGSFIIDSVGSPHAEVEFAPVYLCEAEKPLFVLKHGYDRLWERARGALAIEHKRYRDLLAE